MMVSVEIKDETLKRLLNLINQTEYGIDEYLDYLIRKEEERVEKNYKKFCNETNEELEKLEKKPNNPMNIKDFLMELETW